MEELSLGEQDKKKTNRRKLETFILNSIDPAQSGILFGICGVACAEMDCLKSFALSVNLAGMVCAISFFNIVQE